VPSTIPVPTSTIMDVFANKSYKIKSSKDIDHDKITALEARIMAIKEVDLYDPIQTVKMCLISNAAVPKEFCVPMFIKYTRTQCSVTHLKSYYTKMTEVMHDEKLLMHLFEWSNFRLVHEAG